MDNQGGPRLAGGCGMDPPGLGAWTHRFWSLGSPGFWELIHRWMVPGPTGRWRLNPSGGGVWTKLDVRTRPTVVLTLLNVVWGNLPTGVGDSTQRNELGIYLTVGGISAPGWWVLYPLKGGNSTHLLGADCTHSGY
jgi:hypothetical protein